MRFLKAVSTDALASAARQLSYALQGSADLDGAFVKLYAGADERRRTALQQLEALLRTAPPGAGEQPFRSSPYPTLRWILSLAPTPERSAAAVFQELRRQESFTASDATAAWSEFRGFLTYLAAVLAVLIVVVVMYAVFTLPQFTSLYRGFGAELPGLTRLAFGGPSYVFAGLLFVSVLLLLSLALFVDTLRRRLRRYAPLPARLRGIPLVGPVASTYNQYLWLSCARLLTAAGISAREALRLAAQKTNAADVQLETHAKQSALASDLVVSAELGKLDEELQFQQDAALDAFLTALARCRRRARVVLTVCTYVLVAIFVCAMYLPIFSLGSNM
jgi:type II secretory pathway component PulF